jgi:hypothetical protein
LSARTIPSAVNMAERKPGAETGTQLAFTDRSHPDRSRPRSSHCMIARRSDEPKSIDPRWLRSIRPTRAVSLAVAPTIAPNKGRKAEWGRVIALTQSGHSESPRGTR